jgi:hypothetical protein
MKIKITQQPDDPKTYDITAKGGDRRWLGAILYNKEKRVFGLESDSDTVWTAETLREILIFMESLC